MNRRTFLKMFGIGAAAGLMPGGLFPTIPGTGATENQPNVIIIFADDLGYGDVEGFGVKESPFETPNINRMAAGGAKLTNFHVPVPYCAPSRGTLLTGRYPFRTGLVRNPAQVVNNAQAGSIDIFPTILKAANAHIPDDRTIDGVASCPC